MEGYTGEDDDAKEENKEREKRNGEVPSHASKRGRRLLGSTSGN